MKEVEERPGSPDEPTEPEKPKFKTTKKKKEPKIDETPQAESTPEETFKLALKRKKKPSPEKVSEKPEDIEQVPDSELGEETHVVEQVSLSETVVSLTQETQEELIVERVSSETVSLTQETQEELIVEQEEDRREILSTGQSSLLNSLSLSFQFSVITVELSNSLHV